MKIKLIKQMKIHFIINVCNIKRYYGEPPETITDSSLEEDMDEYKIKSITDQKDNKYLAAAVAAARGAGCHNQLPSNSIFVNNDVGNLRGIVLSVILRTIISLYSSMAEWNIQKISIRGMDQECRGTSPT